MSDVFLSYKAEDRLRLNPLVDALQAEGLSVWWDAHIASGVNWRHEIEQHLDAAKCVIVAWSKRSVAPDGEFVRDEATWAKRRGNYLPILIDSVDPPLGFGEVQALSLTRWKGNRSDPRFLTLVEAVKRFKAGRGIAHALEPAASRQFPRRAVLAGGVAAVAATGVGGWLLLNQQAGTAENSVAVLPFANLSGDPRQAYFSDGIAEELRSALSRIPGLKVIARTSSELVRDVDARAAAHKLRVSDIVTGSVRRTPEMVRIAAQLIGGKDGVERWSHVYDMPDGDTLHIQSEIAEQVAQALSLKLANAGAAQFDIGGSKSPKAQDLFLQAEAVHQSAHDIAGHRRAMTLYDEAIRLDPGYAKAFARKSVAMTELSGSDGTPADWEKAFSEAEVLARKATQLAPDLAAGYSALAFVRWYRLDFRGALTEFKIAHALTGIDGESLANYEYFLGALGLSAQATEIGDKFIGLDPLNPRAYATKARALFYARRYVDALKAAETALKMVPDRRPTLLVAGDCLLLLGRQAEAREIYRRLPPDDPYALTSIAIAEERASDRTASKRILEQIRQLYGTSVSYQVAEIHAQRNEPAEAFAALNDALRFRDPGLTALRTDPFLDPIRKDPRYGSLLERMNFPG